VRTIAAAFVLSCLFALSACQSPTPGDPDAPVVDVNAIATAASDAAVVAARECLARGCTRAEALEAAERAAVASLVHAGIDAIEVDARYRPYINAALLLIELTLTKSPDRPVNLVEVRESVKKAVIDAAGSR
jgi:hypothetical protein